MHLYGAFVKDMEGMSGKEIIELFLQQDVYKEIVKEKDTVSVEKELEAWRNSIPPLISVIEKAGLHNLYIVFEYFTPIGNHRIDCALIGVHKKSQKTIALIIELKQWGWIDTSFKESPTKVRLSKKDILRDHPSAQTHVYCQHMRLNHSNVNNKSLGVLGIQYLHNFPSNKKEDLFSGPYAVYKELKERMFVRDEENRLIQYLQGLFLQDCDENNYKLLTQGEYTFGKTGFMKMQDMLRENRFVVLLKEQQEVSIELADKIKHFDLAAEKRLVVTISGDAGTGKSILGMELMRRFIIDKKSTKCCYTTPSRTLKEIIKGFSQTNVGNSQWVLENRNLDFIVIDEAHRLDKIDLRVEQALKNNKIIILLQDDNQRIKFSEEGSLNKISSAIRKVQKCKGILVEQLFYRLNTQMRAQYSSNYITLLSEFLDCKKSIEDKVDSNYGVNVYDSLQPMDNKMYELLQHNYRCKWIAPFCWRWSNESSKYDIAISDKGFTFEKAWNPSNDQFDWYISKEKNRLNQVACVYTSQGLDYEYTGIIFWDDLYWREGRWHINLNKSCDQKFVQEIVKYYSGKLERIKDNNKWFVKYGKERIELHKFLSDVNYDEERVIQLLKNIYRIILSRASKGINIWFKDNETKNYFCTIMGMSKNENEL